MTTMPGKIESQPSGQAADDDRSDLEALVDFESEQSFPASDPPSWTLGPDKEH